MTLSDAGAAGRHRLHLVWLPRTRARKVALVLDLVVAAFPIWIVPTWYFIAFLVGAGGMFESPRAVAANSIFQSLVVVGALAVNLVALLRARDHSILLALAALPLSAVLVYMGWFTAVNGFPGRARGL
ncbi:hypothetical protein AB4Y86_18090 [Arthrobacter sp. 2YAF22_2]|uniref:hypothetical protein n=1 Tax=Arthrobacter sp. 2YAF22_2 TaxID=3233029 RepID=UPI003F93554B